jgi:hypothetical protein
METLMPATIPSENLPGREGIEEGLDDRLIEVPLLLLAAEAAALEALARQKGLTTDQVVRCLLSDLVRKEATAAAD